MSRYLLISCMFDVAGFEKNTTRRQIDDYLFLFEYHRNSPFEMVLYTDKPDLIKPRNHDLGKLHVVERHIPDLKYYSLIHNTVGINPISYNDKNKDTLTYYSVINSKIDLVAETKRNFPNYDYYVWIDAGYAHVGIIPYDDLDKGLRYNMNGKIRLSLVHYKPKSNPLEQGPDVAGGLMIIPSNKVSWLESTFDETSNLFLSQSVCTYEEATLSIMAYKHTDHIQFIYGIYRYLHNLLYIVEQPASIIEHSLIPARFADNHKLVVDIVKTLLYTWSNRAVHYYVDSAKMLADVLYNGFISSYHIDKELNKTIAKLIHYCYHHVKQVPLFEGKYNNTIDNLKYVNINVTDPIGKLDIIDTPYYRCLWPSLDKW